MPTQITDYKCPACTGPLHYGGPSGKMECDYCGSSFEVSEIEALYAEKDAAACASFEAAEQQTTSGPQQWDTSGLTEDWGESGEHLRIFHCPSCGAQLITDETTAATSCPYCGNNAIVPGQFSGALKPDYILPFRLDKQTAKNALKQHYRKKFLLPKAFTAANHIEEIQGLYVPFWLFDTQAEADCTFHTTRSFIHREGDEQVTVTRHYQVRRAGTMAFQQVPADASQKMPDDYMDSIEPFDYTELKPFSPVYLPGYLADQYDVPAETAMQRAAARCENTALDAMRQDVVGYETVLPAGAQVQLHRGAVHYALMPVWTLRTRWQGQDYLFMMNGQTGKLVGDLPVSKPKFWGLFAALAALFSGLLFQSGVGSWLAQLLLG